MAKTGENKKSQDVDFQAFEKIKAENEKMKNELAKIAKGNVQTIEEKISFFIEKKKKINNLRQFEATKKTILNSFKDLEEDSKNETFENDKFKLIFGSIGYQGRMENELFKISNTCLLCRFNEFILKEIDLKIDTLEKEISL